MEIEEQKRIAKLNGDSPAFRVPQNFEGESGWFDKPDAGLTKREYFAGINMAAFINNPNSHTIDWNNDYAIHVADDLLFKLAGEITNNE